MTTSVPPPDPIRPTTSGRGAATSPGEELMTFLDMLIRQKHSRMYCSSRFMKQSLPDYIASSAALIAARRQTTRDMAAFLLVFAIAAADRGRHRVKGLNGTLHPLALYGAIGQEQLAANSSIADDIRGVFLRYESEKRRMVLQGKTRQAAFMEYPLLYNDFSFEACSFALEHSDSYIALDADKYFVSPELYALLAGCWDGHSPMTATSGKRHMRPYIHILAQVPRQQLHTYVYSPPERTSGMPIRTLFFVPGPDARQVARQEQVPANAQVLFESRLNTLLAASEPTGMEDTHTYIVLDMAEDARLIWNTYCRAKEMPLVSMPADYNAWRKQMAEYALRIAGIFHLVESDHPDNHVISARTMSMAVSFMEILEEHAHCVYTTTLPAEAVIGCARELVQFLAGRKGYISRPFLVRKMQGYGYASAQTLAALALLDEARSMEPDLYNFTSYSRAEQGEQILEKDMYIPDAGYL